jgi:hypothetical protein
MTVFKSIISLLLFLPFALLHLSCKDAAINNYYQGVTAQDSSNKNAYNNIHSVSNNPQSIITYSDLQYFARGTVMTLRVNRNDFEVWEVNVVFDALYKEGPERLILCHSYSNFPVGAGDSGSPLLTSDGRIAGILCYGYYGNSNNFIARAIEDVISIDVNSASSSSTSTLFDAIQPVYIVSGFNVQAASRYPELGNVLGKATIRSDKPFTKGMKISKSAGNLAIPGSSIAVMFITGDYVNEIAIGTMSYLSNENVFAFGHNYQSFLAAPTYLASTKSFITSIEQSFKMSEPSNELIGSFVKDDFNGIVIKKNVVPLIADVNTDCSIEGKSTFSYHHKISNTPSFNYDKSLATNLSCYLLYQEITSQNKSADSVFATCNLQIATDQDIKNKTFVLYNYNIDWEIYSYIEDSVQMAQCSKELKSFNLSIDLKY